MGNEGRFSGGCHCGAIRYEADEAPFWTGWEPARGRPYEDVENFRSETQAMVQTWLQVYGDARDLIYRVVVGGN